MTRYLIIGAGAVGVSIAAELAQAGSDVVLVGRGAQLAALRAGTLRYLTPEGSNAVTVPVVETAQELTLHRDDVLVLTTKTQDADATLAYWAAQPVAGTELLAGQVLPVLTTQNGLDAERSALRRFAIVIAAVLYIPATYITDGEVFVPAGPVRGLVWLGTYPDAAATKISQQIAADLTSANFDTEVVDDLSRWKAAKLLASVTFALDALYEPGPERDRATALLQEETLAILRATGIEPADLQHSSRLSRLRISSVAGRERGGSSSWQSLARGRGVETDFLNGEVVLAARLLGRRAPLNAALQTRIQRAVNAQTPAGSLPAEDLSVLLAAVTVLVDADTLSAELSSATPPALLDVRWALGDPDGEKHYLDGHLPSAVYVDLDTELAAAPTVATGRHPLPAIDDLQRAARRWGLRTGEPVVVYDDNGGQSAARAWWLLRWAGVSDVRILNGGLAAWRSYGGVIETGASQSEPGDVQLQQGHLPTLDADSAAALPASGVLIDARGYPRYLGEIEPIDARAGHIPGAISLPTADNLDADGRFLSPALLRQRFAVAEELGAEKSGKDSDIGVYCGSGVTAAHEIAALQIAGITAALYPGSWSQWAGDSSRPVATGSEPS